MYLSMYELKYACMYVSRLAIQSHANANSLTSGWYYRDELPTTFLVPTCDRSVIGNRHQGEIAPKKGHPKGSSSLARRSGEKGGEIRSEVRVGREARRQGARGWGSRTLRRESPCIVIKSDEFEIEKRAIFQST